VGDEHIGESTDRQHWAGKRETGIGTYQSSTSALPVKAWQIIITLFLSSFSLPHVLYATGASWRVSPFSSSKEGTTSVACSIRLAKPLIVVDVLLRKRLYREVQSQGKSCKVESEANAERDEK
jgi:hypothetical protein